MTGEIERAGSGFGPRSALVFRGRWVEELVCCVTAVYVAFAPVGEGAPVASGVRHEASGAKFCAAALPCPGRGGGTLAQRAAAGCQSTRGWILRLAAYDCTRDRSNSMSLSCLEGCCARVNVLKHHRFCTSSTSTAAGARTIRITSKS